MEWRKLKGYKYQLMEPISFKTSYKYGVKIKAPFIRLGKTGALRVLTGYAWDGTSGPTPIDSESTMRPSLFHDACYQLIREKWLPTSKWEENKRIADKMFYDLLLEDGMGKIRAWYYWKAVSWFGASHCRPSPSP